MPNITKICAVSGREFVITEEDQAFYQKMQVPFPRLCPEERRRRRMAFRNEMTLYHRTCDVTGKKLISMYSQDVPFPVYDIDYWYSDAWEPASQEYDFSRPFFEQFYELSLKVPRMNLIMAQPLENSEFNNCAIELKNCYYTWDMSNAEDCMYIWKGYDIRQCINSAMVSNCELVYECLDCKHGYYLKWCIASDNCSNSTFLSHCRSCSDCFACVGLERKQYCFLNEQLTEEEYKKRLQQLNTGSFAVVKEWKEKVQDLEQTFLKEKLRGLSNEDVSGNYLYYCKNVHNSFVCQNLEDSRYCDGQAFGKDCYDITIFGLDVELMYESQTGGSHCYNIKFCQNSGVNLQNLEYCDLCFTNVRDCFGCVGLQKKQYCILNKQYTKEEYEDMIPRIKTHMLQNGEYGEFFPGYMSPYGYNETGAQRFYPLTKEEALQRGFRWRDEQEKKEVYQPYQVPDSIQDVQDDIIGATLICEDTGQPYKITKQELAWYRYFNVPLPRKAPRERLEQKICSLQMFKKSFTSE